MENEEPIINHNIEEEQGALLQKDFIDRAEIDGDLEDSINDNKNGRKRWMLPVAAFALFSGGVATALMLSDDGGQKERQAVEEIAPTTTTTLPHKTPLTTEHNDVTTTTVPVAESSNGEKYSSLSYSLSRASLGEEEKGLLEKMNIEYGYPATLNFGYDPSLYKAESEEDSYKMAYRHIVHDYFAAINTLNKDMADRVFTADLEGDFMDFARTLTRNGDTFYYPSSKQDSLDSFEIQDFTYEDNGDSFRVSGTFYYVGISYQFLDETSFEPIYEGAQIYKFSEYMDFSAQVDKTTYRLISQNTRT